MLRWERGVKQQGGNGEVGTGLPGGLSFVKMGRERMRKDKGLLEKCGERSHVPLLLAVVAPMLQL